MSRNPSDAAVKAWTGLVRARDRVFGGIEQDLKAAGCPPLAWYDVLLELTRAPDGRLRPFEIERETLLAQYNLSRLIDRLEKEGLIVREPCDSDARGQWVVITGQGRAVQARAWKVYARSIQQHVGTRLDDSAAAALAALLAGSPDGRSAARPALILPRGPRTITNGLGFLCAVSSSERSPLAGLLLAHTHAAAQAPPPAAPLQILPPTRLA